MIGCEQLNQALLDLREMLWRSRAISSREAGLQKPRLFECHPRGKSGTVAVMGNWEYWSGETAHTWRALAEYDIRLL